MPATSFIEGFAIANGGTITRAGIRSVINQHVVIRNNQIDQAGRWGIITGFSDNLTIENNITSRSQIEHGIYVYNSSVNAVVRSNLEQPSLQGQHRYFQ